jgi:hypothetical protein
MDDRSPLWRQTKIPIETPLVHHQCFFQANFGYILTGKKYDSIILKGFFMKQMAPDSPDFKGK